MPARKLPALRQAAIARRILLIGWPAVHHLRPGGAVRLVLKSLSPAQRRKLLDELAELGRWDAVAPNLY
jgi:hypothetical protein